MRWVLALMLAAPPALAQDGAALFAGTEVLEARLGGPDGPVLPGGRFSCAGCHGADGRGGAEGGGQPAPPIDWASLAASTPLRPAYDDAALSRLLTQGITPAGRAVSPRMPRFRATPGQVAALADHLRKLDARERQGLDPDRIAVTLPGDPALRAAALAAIAAFNAEGGAFGRRIVATDDPAFLDLGAAIATLVPRLHQAEEDRLASLLDADPGLHAFSDAPAAARVAGTMDQIGPSLSSILAQGGEVQAVGPLDTALAWAMASGHDAQAAHAYVATRAALEALREQGRNPTRTRFDTALDVLDVSPMIQIYRHDGE